MVGSVWLPTSNHGCLLSEISYGREVCKHKVKSLRWLEALINTWISSRCLEKAKHILPNGVKQMVIYHGTIRKISLKQIQVRVLFKLLIDHGYLTYDPRHPFLVEQTSRCRWFLRKKSLVVIKSKQNFGSNRKKLTKSKKHCNLSTKIQVLSSNTY